MAKITKVSSGKESFSYKITLPKAFAEDYIEKYGTDVKISIADGGGFDLRPIKEG